MPRPVKWLFLWYIPVGIINIWGYTETLPDLFTAESFLQSTHCWQSKGISSAHVVKVYYNMVDLDTAHFMTLLFKKCERTMNSHLMDIGSHYLPWKWSNLFKENCINRKTKGLSKPTFKCYLQLFFSLIGGSFLFFHRFAIDILSP